MAAEGLIETPYLPDGYVELDGNGGLVRFNRRALELYGIDRAEAERLHALSPAERFTRLVALITPRVADPPTFLAALRRHVGAGQGTETEDVPLRDGRILERHSGPTRDGAGTVVGRGAWLRDITARRREERELAERARRHEALAALGELALFAEDLEALTRLAVRLVPGALGADLVHYLELLPDRRLLVLRHVNVPDGSIGPEPISVDSGSMSGYTLESNGSVVTSDLESEGRFTAPRLRAIGVRSGFSVIVRGRERPQGILAAFWRRPRSFAPAEVGFLEAAANVVAASMARADVEARLRAREQEARAIQGRLALADRMASVGTLAAGVAHELNNPLAYVVANLSFAAEALERRSPALDPELAADLTGAVREAREGAEKMRAIIRDLRTFSRVGEGRSGPVDVRAVLESCVSMAWSEIKHRARLAWEIGDVPPVLGNDAKLGQVFLNLLVNAAQAIPDGDADRNEIRLVARAAEGGRVAVEVRDTGCGISPEDRPRIFDPFFTTKPVGEGTGLGLTICHNIVAAQGGAIEVESRPGAGSTFRVLLPAAPEQPDAGAGRPPRPSGAPRRGRVLVVDDEPLVGQAIRRALGPDHDVTVVQGGRQALERLSNGEVFDAVVSDLLMPEVSGMDLHQEIARRDPALAGRMVFVTGGAYTPAARVFVEAHRDRVVEKPFEAASLREQVRRHIGS